MEGSNENRIDFNAVLKIIGPFGRFQKVRYFFLCLVSVICGIAAVSWVFQAYNVLHRCRNPYCEPLIDENSIYSYFDHEGGFPAYIDSNLVDSCQFMDLKVLIFSQRLKLLSFLAEA